MTKSPSVLVVRDLFVMLKDVYRVTKMQISGESLKLTFGTLDKLQECCDQFVSGQVAYHAVPVSEIVLIYQDKVIRRLLIIRVNKETRQYEQRNQNKYG